MTGPAWNHPARCGRAAGVLPSSLRPGGAAADHDIVFVIGVHRSGTSLLHGILGLHPDTSRFTDTGVPEDEGQHIQSVVPAALAHGGPGKFAFDERAYMTEQHELATPESADRMFRDWATHWDLERRYLLEKSPPNILRTRFLQALFPRARFVAVIRHPIPVSYSTSRWSGTDLENLTEHWLLCHERLREDFAHLEHAIVLRYEDLVASPVAQMARVTEFLGLSWFPEHLLPETRDGNHSYLARWSRQRHHWRSRWGSARLISRCEDRVREFGYSLRDPGEITDLTFSEPGPTASSLSR